MLTVEVKGEKVQIPDDKRTVCEVWTRRLYGIFSSSICLQHW